MIAAVAAGLLSLSSWQAMTATPAAYVPLPDRDPAALAVATCESGDGEGTYSYTAENPTSSASGAYQFISSTWTSVTGLPAPASAHPPAVQDAAFLELWDDGRGASHWSPSRHCWGRP